MQISYFSSKILNSPLIILIVYIYISFYTYLGSRVT